MNHQEVMRLALEALEKVKADADKQPPVYPWDVWRMWVDGAITALRAALAEPEQEPVAWMYDFLNPNNREEVIRNWVTQNPDDIEREKGFNVRPLYTAPTPNTLEESNGRD